MGVCGSIQDLVITTCRHLKNLVTIAGSDATRIRIVEKLVENRIDQSTVLFILAGTKYVGGAKTTRNA